MTAKKRIKNSPSDFKIRKVSFVLQLGEPSHTIRFRVRLKGEGDATISWFSKGKNDSYNQSNAGDDNTYDKNEELLPGEYTYVLHGHLLHGAIAIISIDDITDLANVVPLIVPQEYDTTVIADIFPYEIK